MSKNMTRKGAAIASGLALAGAGLVAAPAQATETGQLFAADGPPNNMVGVMGHDFFLDYTGVGVEAGDLSGFVQASVVPKAGQTADIDFVDVVGDDTKANLDPANANDGDVTIESADTVDDNAIALGAPTNLTESLTVEIFLQYADGSRSETERITFLPMDEVSATLTVSKPQIADNQTVVGTFSLNGINTGNFIENNTDAVQEGTGADDDLDLELQNGGATLANNTIAFNETLDAYVYTTANTIDLSGAAENDITFEAYFDNTEVNEFFDADADSAEVSYTLSAADAYERMDIEVETSAAIHNSSGTGTDFVAAETVLAPAGTERLTFTISLFTDTDKTVAAGKDIPVTVTLGDNSNALGTSTVSASGQTLTVANDSVSFTKDTNSSGQISFTAVVDNAEDGESFTIDAQGPVAGGARDIDQTTVEYDDAAMTALPAVDGDFTIAPGDSLSLDYTVIDQFGNTADSDYQLVFTREEASGDRDSSAEYANWSYVAPVSADGTASVTIVDNGAADVEGVDTVTATVQQKAGSGSGFVAASGATNDTFTLTYDNDLADMDLTAEASYDGIENSDGDVIHPLKIETKTLENFDSRIGGEKPEYNTDGETDRGNVPDVTIDADYDVGDDVANVVGTVNTSGGDPVEGVAVRLSADGMNFSDEETLAAATILSNDSITVFTDATGSYEAFFRSGNAGAQTITVDAQGTTDSVEVRFQNSTGVAEGLNLDISNPAINPGARADIVATIVDAQGQPVPGVTVNFKDKGPGVLNASTAVTDIFGEAQVTLSTEKEESSGQTEITAYATIGGVNVVQRATVTVGSGAAGGGYPAGASMNAWTVNQDDGTAKVYVKFPTIDEKLRIGHQKNGSGSYETIYVKTLDSETHEDLTVNVEGSYIVRTIDLVDGTNRIRVTVGDDREVQVRYNE